MKKVVKTYDVYSFDELSKEAKEKAIQQQREWQENDNYWYMDEYYEEIAKDYGFEANFNDLCFDLYHNFAYFSKLYLTDKFWDIFLKTIKDKDKKRYIKNGIDTATITITGWDEGNNVEVEYYPTDEKEGAKVALLENNVDLEGMIYEYIKAMNKELLEVLQKNYDEITSDDYLIEMINANEYEYLATGEMFNE